MLVNETVIPTMYDFSSHVSNKLFDEFNEYMVSAYDASAIFDYSKCSLTKGWNIKYKKCGKSLCTIYPDENKFTVMVVISRKEYSGFMDIYSSLHSCIHSTYETNKDKNGYCWLMIEVLDENVIDDV